MLAMARLSQEMKKFNNTPVCSLPFCLTVEAEAMGAEIKLDDMKNGPRVKQYAFTQIEELENIQKINVSQGRIKAVLDAVAYLSGRDETVALTIEGPFTILASLIEPKTLYKAMRKNHESVDRILEIIEENIVEYALKGLLNGVKILSYADPVGAIDILGPQMYRSHSGRVTARILHTLSSKPHAAIIHLCGKSSTALEKTGFCQSSCVAHAQSQTYLELLSTLMADTGCTRIIGHSCFRQIPWEQKHPHVQEIKILPG